MTRSIILLFLFLPLFTYASPMLDGALCELAVYQTDTAQSVKPVLLLRDTVEILKGIRISGFLVTFSLEIDLTKLDSDRVEYITHIVTLGPDINTYARQFQSPYGLAGRVEPIIGKAGATYALAIKPLKQISVDTSGCGFLLSRKEDFNADPSAHADIYFVPHSHGDYLWNNIKFHLQDRYENFADLVKFGLPGKCQFYLCPCPIRSVIWDKRFYTMVDPTRNAVFTIYTKEFNSADPVTLIQAALYRHYGYAPPFIVEGMAGYLTLATFDVTEFVKTGKLVPLDSLLSSFHYLNTDPNVAENSASSFCKYLIDVYQSDKFMDWYRRSDDLNIWRALNDVYGKSLAELEQDWLHYVDTITFKAQRLAQAATHAETMFQYGRMARYRDEQLRVVGDREDSLRVLSELARAQMFIGDYDQAVTCQKLLVSLDTTPDPDKMLTLGTYSLMRGEYNSALSILMKAQQLDTVDPVIAFNIAHYWLLKGDKVKARQQLEQLVARTNQGSASAESRVMLANLLRESKANLDQKRAIEYYSEAIQLLAQTTSGEMISAVSVMWSGIAFLGKGDTGSAQEYLSTALFLETRPFYQAMILLWMGKTADLRGERDVAEQNYRAALEVKGAEYHRDEAKALLIKPYK